MKPSSKTALVLVSAILLTFRIYVRAHTSHACKDGQVMLNCRSGSILITDVFLADSKCSRSRCCPRVNDCKGSPSPQYRNSVLNSCNGRQNCRVDVEIRDIGCGTFAPRNDYVNISYDCQASTTTTTTTTATTTTTTKTTVPTSPLIPNLPGAVLTPTERPPSTTGPQLELELPSVAEVLVTDERSKGQGLEAQKTSPGSVKTTKDSLLGEKEAQKQLYTADGNQNPDRMTIMTALIVAGIVIVTAVISAAVVMALKKRRIPKKDSSYELPSAAHLTSAPEADDDQHRRGSNFYDFIPDFRDSGHCSGREEEGDEAAAAKENEYLKPMTDDEERPYDWIP